MFIHRVAFYKSRKVHNKSFVVFCYISKNTDQLNIVICKFTTPKNAQIIYIFEGPIDDFCEKVYANDFLHTFMYQTV